MSFIDNKIAYFKEMQSDIMTMANQLEKMKTKYKTELEEAFGITDGKTLNALEFVECMYRVLSAASHHFDEV